MIRGNSIKLPHFFGNSFGNSSEKQGNKLSANYTSNFHEYILLIKLRELWLEFQFQQLSENFPKQNRRLGSCHGDDGLNEESIASDK